MEGEFGRGASVMDAVAEMGSHPDIPSDTQVGDKLSVASPLPESWDAAVAYEQLLTILQHQHNLALQHKEAEVANLQSRLDLIAEPVPEGGSQYVAALHKKEEECAIAMAAKHKELELLASLLQLREQQIEEFRQVCEAQSVELQELRRHHRRQNRSRTNTRRSSSTAPPQYEQEQQVSATVRHAAPGPTHSEETTAHSRQLIAALQAQAEGDESRSKLNREVKQLRLRMEELESVVEDQREQNTVLVQSLAETSKRAQTFEHHSFHAGDNLHRSERSLPSPEETASLLEAKVTASLPAQSTSAGDDLAVTATSVAHSRRSSLHGAGAAAPAGAPGGAWSFATPDWRAPQANGAHARESELQTSAPSAPSPAYHSARRSSHAATLTRSSSSGHHEPMRKHDLPSPGQWLESRASPSSQTASALPTEPVAHVGSAHMPPAGTSDPSPEASRQSHHLLQEMSRLRQQMSDLERIAAASSSPLQQDEPLRSQPAASPLQSGLHHSQGLDVSSSSLEGIEQKRTVFAAQRRSEVPAMPSGSSLPPPQKIGLARWEYRPHSSGDSLDASIAQLVNQPGGRYHPFRALLCRLEAGVYLCGARRMHLKVVKGNDGDVIMASDDSGASWVDLAESGVQSPARALRGGLSEARQRSDGGMLSAEALSRLNELHVQNDPQGLTRNVGGSLSSTIPNAYRSSYQGPNDATFARRLEQAAAVAAR